MKIEYQIKGITLNEFELMEIHQYYEAARTAEYIMENRTEFTEEQAMKIGYAAREKMNKYDYEENEAIDEAIDELREGGLL